MDESTIATFAIKKCTYIDSTSKLIQPLPKFFTAEVLQTLYEKMHLLRAMDSKAVNLQRTGKMSTYPSSRGQEAISIGTGHAMNESDVLCPYYRDQGTLIQRKMRISDLYQFWGGDERGNVFKHNIEDFPICIPIATQYLHATGVAFAVQYRQQQRAVVVTGGEGSTSKGDFYEAINLAGAWQLPLVFVINNNQWAISVPSKKQTNCETYAQKGIAAGIACHQVDGNDVIAVRETVSSALQKARAGNGPTLIEATSYRLCDHTTADDASRYQPRQEMEAAEKQEPIGRLRRYMLQKGIWSEQQEVKLTEDIKQTIDSAVKEYLQQSPQQTTDLIDHTFATLPDMLLDQRDELGEEQCQ